MSALVPGRWAQELAISVWLDDVEMARFRSPKAAEEYALRLEIEKASELSMSEVTVTFPLDFPIGESLVFTTEHLRTAVRLR